jgi:hypothetical protein
VLLVTWICLLVRVPSRLFVEPTLLTTSPSPAGMAIAGVGTGINELTALAGTAELVPLSHRGYYIAGLVLTVLPLLPSVMYAQMIASHATWRYIAVVTGAWATAALVTTALFYHPPPPPRSRGHETWCQRLKLFKQTDFFGGVLSIGGLAGFEAGILMGGYQVREINTETDK